MGDRMAYIFEEAFSLVMSRRGEISSVTVGDTSINLLGVDRIGENVTLREVGLRMQGKYWLSQMGYGFYVGSERSS